jgi:gamma-glutamyl:cysteine ligase YbdK (ATP-grasp superfamily)
MGRRFRCRRRGPEIEPRRPGAATEATVGQEIDSVAFRPEDFRRFRQRLDQETGVLRQWFREGRLESGPLTAGLELEAWLVGADMRPAPVNEACLERLGSDLVVPELARFNVELNTTPHRLTGGGLGAMAAELEGTRAACSRAAAELDARMLWVGVLPTLVPGDLGLDTMSPMRRYRALNEQVLRLRGDEPIHVDIRGREHLLMDHHSVMLEAAATSLQLHLQVPPEEAARYYNAAVVLSGPMVAACANAPYLFGHDLWAESRIPLFEQAVAVTDHPDGVHAPRVTFGADYLRGSAFQCFEENRRRFAVLLPRLMDEERETLPHLRLHNGTIWRWNRPLLGFDPATGRPHLRIEHRVASAPTTVTDAMAAAALFFGAVETLARRDRPPEADLAFADARHNFYAAARDGLDAELRRPGGGMAPAAAVLREEVLPAAREGLAALGVNAGDADALLGVIAGRLATGQNGAAWQRAFVAAHGRDFAALTEAYAERQRSGMPVHEWPVG